MAQRRLAAIMFSDIVGYDSLLKEDEKKAFDTRKKNQRIHRRLIKKFKGRWLKEMESGTLASFSSIIDAIMCAFSIQKATEELNIPIRIGMHQGEVIFEKKDVLGDGVNIASRIHSLIDSNGIIISDTVYKDIRNKEGLVFESLGSNTLKGVQSPVGIYSVSCHDESILDFTIDTGELARPFIYRRTSLVAGIMVIALLAFTLYYFLPKSTQSSSKLGRSVLVLPFENLTSDTLDYFAEGMHDILIGNVGKISALRVLGQTTANTYKDTEKSFKEIAKEREVNTLIKGTVLCIGDNICLQMKLLDQDGNEVWTQDFEVEISQILNLYNTVTKEISSELGVLLTLNEERLLSKTRTVDREAYDEYLKARSYSIDQGPESVFKAMDYLNSAIEKEPDWAPLYAGLAELWLWAHMGNYEPSVTVPKIYENLNMAMELDPDLAEVHFVSALIAQWVEWNWEKSEKEFLKALAINPNDQNTRLFYAQLLLILQRNDESLAQRELAIGLDPLNSQGKLLYLGTLVLAGDNKAAVSFGEEYLTVHPMDRNANGVIEAAAYRLGEYDKVIKSLKYSLPLLMVGDVYDSIVNIYNESGIVAAYEELMIHFEKYAENNPVSICDFAYLYIRADQPDKALDWLEKAFEIHDPNIMYFITTERFNEQLFDNPRFIAICENAKLPLP